MDWQLEPDREFLLDRLGELIDTVDPVPEIVNTRARTAFAMYHAASSSLVSPSVASGDRSREEESCDSNHAPD